MKVGRALIALLLGNRFHRVSSPDSLGAETADWLGYIIGKMHSGAQDCGEFVQGNEEVRFVTFNFDSIIEDRLEKAILNLYRGAAEGRLRYAVEAIHRQIIHVHGQLTPPPGPLLPLHQFSDWGKWINWLSSAPSQIRVVMDQIEANILAAAQEAVRQSKILCFLGFAYANDNLIRLDFPNALNHGVDGKWVGRSIYGTAFGLRPGEKAWVMDKLKGFTALGDESEGCFDFLRNHHIFKD